MTDDTLEYCLKGLRDPDKTVRARNMEKLAEIGTPAVSSLMILLSDSDWVVRYRAAEALGCIRDPVSTGHLITLTGDSKDHVRYMAAKALGGMKDDRIPPVLVRLLRDNHLYTRRIASAGIAASKDLAAGDALRAAMETEHDLETREIFRKDLILMKKG
ncbi:MAG: HEAT repeat domain-containing protein [Methanospirillum sp.]|nr:HEAT repeat domain-containing protein [Methanospirillum sp.]